MQEGRFEYQLNEHERRLVKVEEACGKVDVLANEVHNQGDLLARVEKGQSRIVYSLLGLILTVLGGLILASATHGFGLQ